MAAQQSSAVPSETVSANGDAKLIDTADGELAALSSAAALPSIPFELGNPAVEIIEGRLILSAPPPPLKPAAAALEDELADPLDDSFDAFDEEDEAESKEVPDNVHQTSLVALFDIPAHITLSELHSFLLDSPSLGGAVSRGSELG